MPFAASQYFGFERSWLSRAIKSLNREDNIFAKKRKEEAQLKLGLGFRQIESLKDWLKAMKAIRKEKRYSYSLTEIGEYFLEFDSLIEERGTWWTIHYQLSSNQTGIEVYYWFFNHFDIRKVTREKLITALTKFRSDLSVSTIENAVTSLLSVFANSPLGDDLKILKEVEKQTYQRFEPEKKKLHPAVVAYAIVDWAKNRDRSTVNVRELLSSDGAPGKVFGLSARLLDNYLDEIRGRYKGKVLSVSRTAGLNSVTYDQNIKPLSLLRAYYLETLDRLEPMEALRKAIKHG